MKSKRFKTYSYVKIIFPSQSSPSSICYEIRALVIICIIGPPPPQKKINVLATYLTQASIKFFFAATTTDGRSDRRSQSSGARTESLVATSSGRTTPVAATIATAPDATGQRLRICKYTTIDLLTFRPVFLLTWVTR